MSRKRCQFWSNVMSIVLLLLVVRMATAGERIEPPKEFVGLQQVSVAVMKAGVYAVEGDCDGHRYWGTCLIVKHGDAWKVASLLQMDKKNLQMTSGVGLCTDGKFAVGGASGAALYAIEGDKLTGKWTSDNGRVYTERLTLLKEQPE